MPRVQRIMEDPPPDWQTTYCCLAILLVAFFVMLCSYASLEEGKIVEVRTSFIGAINIFSGGVLFEEGEGIVVPSPEKYSQSVIKIATPIHQFLKGKGLEEKVSLKSTNDYVSLTLLDSVLFDERSADIAAEAKPILRKLARILSKFSVPVRIEGHTDDSPADSNRYNSNWELSAMRATNVLRFFKDEGNIPPERLSATGFSQYRPFVPNRKDEERRRNRRVEIIIPIVQEFFKGGESIIRETPASFKTWDLTG